MQAAERKERIIARLQRKVDLLKANREQVGEEVLKTTYAKAYNKLLKEIKVYSAALLQEVCLGASFRIECMQELNNMKNDFSSLILNNYDIQGAVESAQDYLAEAMWKGLATLRFEFNPVELENVEHIEKMLMDCPR